MLVKVQKKQGDEAKKSKMDFQEEEIRLNKEFIFSYTKYNYPDIDY